MCTTQRAHDAMWPRSGAHQEAHSDHHHTQTNEYKKLVVIRMLEQLLEEKSIEERLIIVLVSLQENEKGCAPW